MKFVEIDDFCIPRLGFGTWQIGGEACREAVRDALDLGYRHIDTAQAYENEEPVGQGLRDAGVARDEVFLTTKLWRTNLRPDDVTRSAQASLRRLGTDYVDLLLIHWPSDEIPVAETLGAMQRLVEDGSVRHIGVSNFPPRLLAEALEHGPVVCDQVEYHPFLDQGRLLELCRERGVALTAYSPLARGKVLEDETLRDIAGAHGRSPAQVALRWLVQQDVVAAVPKASSPEHRRANFAVFDFELADDEMARIDALTARDERLIDPGWAPDWGG